ncbi:site-specific integrase [Polynucleobacter sp. IMCC30063]|uniref:tyrosine-type recombinase/integrase n=1 Tax=Polynucleobacter sp. IMCC30063 TaxID=2907298 RepID=UPI001F305CAC|nr:site-specific integrase [Polynucleobacter sp. IMCC30063]MCE7506720.1 site-specific integrase [Polynucleobacter sp. IMCC30063]
MASIRFRSNKWQARVFRQGQQALVKTFYSKEDAQRWARSIEVEWDKGTYTSIHQAQKTTLGELIERYLREVTPLMRGASADTIRLKAMMRRLIAKENMATLTPSKIAKYRDERLQEIKPSTVIRELAYFSAIINHARREWGLSIPNPVLGVRKPAQPQGRNRILTFDEEQLLLDACKPLANRNIYTRPFVILAIETAMRRGELLSLRWDNINYQTRTAHLALTKNGESRTVPLSTRAIETLQALPRSIDGRVLPVNFAALENNFKRARERAGLKDLRIHDLRHTAATRLAEKLPNLLELSAVTGHKSLAMLKRYYHPNPQQLALKLG